LDLFYPYRQFQLPIASTKYDSFMGNAFRGRLYGTHLLPSHARRAVHSFLYEMINKYKIDFREILQYFANAQLASFLSVLCSSRHKSEAKHFSSSITMTRLHQSYNYDDWSTRHKHYNLPYSWFQLLTTM
jgi:hypothetical protein